MKAAEDLGRQLMGMSLLTSVYRVKLPSGVIKHVEMSVSNLKEAAGNIIGFVASIRDITERIRMERDLRKALDDLQRSNKDLEQFVYVASHDMQEPLRMISSYTQLLGKRYKGKLDSDADEFIGFAVDGASRMQKMINDLLIFSRVTPRGKDFEPVDLEKVLSDAIDNLKIAIEENKATITHDPLPKVMADEPQMVRLLQNIIGNAIKFHGQEPPIIHVGAKEEMEEWAISVKDNGIGIDKKFFDHLFIVFQRLHTRDQYPGTGIGLAVCKKTVERHGGRIWVESEGEGKGSAFTFTLPKRALTKKVETAKSLQENDQENDYEKKEDKK
jgi:light-regulated signal transduction histidine kinase (bacteriophytochrome)